MNQPDVKFDVTWRRTWDGMWFFPLSYHIVDGEGAPEAPPHTHTHKHLGVSCVIAKRLEIARWNLMTFKGHSLLTFCYFLGTRSGQVTCPSSKKVCKHAMATVRVGSVWILQDCMRSSVPIACVWEFSSWLRKVRLYAWPLYYKHMGKYRNVSRFA